MKKAGYVDVGLYEFSLALKPFLLLDFPLLFKKMQKVQKVDRVRKSHIFK